MNDLWIMVAIHSIHYVDESVLVLYDGEVYSISLDTPMQNTSIASNVIVVPTHALKPREYYSELSVAKYAKEIMDNL